MEEEIAIAIMFLLDLIFLFSIIFVLFLFVGLFLLMVFDIDLIDISIENKGLYNYIKNKLQKK